MGWEKLRIVLLLNYVSVNTKMLSLYTVTESWRAVTEAPTRSLIGSEYFSILSHRLRPVIMAIAFLKTNVTRFVPTLVFVIVFHSV